MSLSERCRAKKKIYILGKRELVAKPLGSFFFFALLSMFYHLFAAEKSVPHFTARS